MGFWDRAVSIGGKVGGGALASGGRIADASIDNRGKINDAVRDYGAREYEKDRNSTGRNNKY